MLMHIDQGHPFHERLKNMEEYVQKGSDLTQQLLGSARGGKYVKSGRPTLAKSAVPAAAEMFGQNQKRNIHPPYRGKDLWHVDVDLGQMDQVLLNLFVNAWQAMPGGGNLYIAVENTELGAQDVAGFGRHAGQICQADGEGHGSRNG